MNHRSFTFLDVSGEIMLGTTALYFCFLLSFVCSEFILTILHTNDFHSRIEETDQFGSLCREEDKRSGICFGGAARLLTEVKKLRKNNKNVLLVDGGDQQTGTLWYKTFYGNMTARVLNKLQYDAMVLGNHDFDEGADHTLRYLKQLAAPVVLSNLNASAEIKWNKKTRLWKHFLMFTIEGRKVGICGYVIKWIEGMKGMRNLRFRDEVMAIRQCAETVKAQGAKIIIALGHAGIDKDKEIARDVEDVDIVIGGHSNTFMYTGTPPSVETPYSKYPLVVRKTKSNRIAVVAQAYAYGKYLGFLKVSFDDLGNIVKWGGNPVLLKQNIREEKGMRSEILKYSVKVDKIGKVPVARSNVMLDGRRSACWKRECILGNLITNALVFYGSKESVNDNQWSDVSVAFWPSGGIRASIPLHYQENITFGDIYNMLPYENKIVKISIRGNTLKATLQYSLSQMRPENHYQSSLLLQVSGLRVQVKLDKNGRYFVNKVLVLCTKCRIPQYEPLKEEGLYKVMTSKYIADGGMGFTILKSKREAMELGLKTDVELVIEYLQTHNPFVQAIEGRITFNNTQSSQTTGGLLLFKPFIILYFIASVACGCIIFS